MRGLMRYLIIQLVMQSSVQQIVSILIQQFALNAFQTVR